MGGTRNPSMIPPSFPSAVSIGGNASSSPTARAFTPAPSNRVKPTVQPARDGWFCEFNGCGHYIDASAGGGGVRKHLKEEHPELKGNAMSKCLWPACENPDMMKVTSIYNHVISSHLHINQQECCWCLKLLRRPDSLKRHQEWNCEVLSMFLPRFVPLEYDSDSEMNTERGWRCN